MAKSSTPVEKAARLLDLVPFISSHQGISLVDLAEQFKISQSELLSDLNTLWMCGLPGYTPLELIDLEFESGFVSIRNAEILQNVRTLSKEELVILAIGLDLISTALDEARPELEENLRSLQEKIRLLIGEIVTVEPTVNSSHRAVILQALESRRDLQIRYHSLIRDSISERQITPIEMSFDHGYEVVRAYCHSAKAFRSFRLDNVKAIDLCAPSFEVQTYSESDPYSIELRVTDRLRSVMERFRISFDQNRRASAENLIATSFSQDWLMRNALSTLASTEVLAPSEFRSAVARRCQIMLELYGDSSFAVVGE